MYCMGFSILGYPVIAGQSGAGGAIRAPLDGNDARAAAISTHRLARGRQGEKQERNVRHAMR
jgi:hypothetical protein